MKPTFNWHRYNISLKDYRNLMWLSDNREDGSKEQNDKLKPKYEKAYEAAEKIRQFEIELFWKRATFFWAFIVAITYSDGMYKWN